jgi:two-component system, OmpR family, response regulator QseB
MLSLRTLNGGLSYFAVHCAKPSQEACQCGHPRMAWLFRALDGQQIMRTLLLEDDLQLGKALQTALVQSDFQTVWVRRVQEAKTLLAADSFAVVLLDIGLPDGSGLDVLRWLRANKQAVPVIMLTARDTIDDRIQGLDMGADDYMPKPFAIPELISRIRAISRRSMGFVEEVWHIDDITLEPAKHKASMAGKQLELPLREYTLLLELARSAGRFVTRAKLEQALFSNQADIESNALEVHVHHLRKKLGSERIRTIRGVGYLLETSE